MKPYSVADQLLSRMWGSRGSVWTAKDFLDLASRSAIDQALRRLTADGRIRKVSRGLYDIPRFGKLVGKMAPATDAIANATGRSRGTRVRPSGAVVANNLGLSTQVPVKATYLTDGKETEINLGRRRIKLRRVTSKRLAAASLAGGIVEAFQHIGRDQVESLTQADIDRVSNALSYGSVSDLSQAARSAPDWMRPTLNRIISEVKKKNKART